MAKPSTEELVMLDQLKAKCSDLAKNVAHMRNEYSKHCTDHYSKVLKMEHEQLKHTNFVIPKTTSAKVSSKYGSTPLDELFPFSKTSFDKNDQLLKLDRLIKDVKYMEEAAAIIDEMNKDDISL